MLAPYIRSQTLAQPAVARRSPPSLRLEHRWRVPLVAGFRSCRQFDQDDHAEAVAPGVGTDCWQAGVGLVRRYGWLISPRRRARAR
jgi:hypothetical protein